MESVNCPLCDILHSVFSSQICWFQLVTYFLYFFGPICHPSHVVKRVKKKKKKAYNCSFRHTMLLGVLLLNSSEKIIEEHVADEKEST